MNEEGVEHVHAEREAGVRPDSAGYVIVSLDRDAGLLRADHYTTDDEHTVRVEGEDPIAVYHELVERDLISRLDHAAYLGRELTRAERALETGEEYEQGCC